MSSKIKRNCSGQGLVEYALVLVLVAVVVIGILTILGPQIGNVFSRVTIGLDGSGGASAGAAQPVIVKVENVTHVGSTVTMTITVSEATGVTLTDSNGAPSPPATLCDTVCVASIVVGGPSGVVTVSAGNSVDVSYN